MKNLRKIFKNLRMIKIQFLYNIFLPTLSTIDYKKIIRCRNFSDLLNKDHRLEISNIDQNLLFFQYKNKTDNTQVRCDKLLSKIENLMDSNTSIRVLKIEKTKGSIEYSIEKS